MTIPFSILDLSPIPQGATASDAFRNSLDLAQHAERWGYHRYWLAEHHNMPGIASAATVHRHRPRRRRHEDDSRRLRRHHAAEPRAAGHRRAVRHAGVAFPGRIDLGLGRAPGTDTPTARALRRDLASSADRFPDDVVELHTISKRSPGQKIRAVPGAGLNVPIWLLGSSLQRAARRTPGPSLRVCLAFRTRRHAGRAAPLPPIFKPSKQLDHPYVMLGINVIAAETDGEARHHFTSLQRSFTNLRRGMPGQIPPPIDDIDTFWSPAEKALASQTLTVSAVGSPETVTRGLQNFLDVTHPDELIITAHIYDHRARLRSFELVSDLRANLTAAEAKATA